MKKIKKITILCNNKDEFTKTIKYFYHIGLIDNKKYNDIMTYYQFIFPTIVKNYKCGDIYGSNFLICDRYKFFVEYNLINKLVNIQTANSFFRKIKINKLNEINLKFL